MQQRNIRESNSNHKSILHLNWIQQELVHLRPFIRSSIKLFKLDEKASCPEILMEEVLTWTGGQPFLTQKVCQLICEQENFINTGEEAVTVEHLVRTRIIEDWGTQVAAKHLQEIYDNLVNNQQCEPVWLLKLYQQILQQGEVLTNDSLAQVKLLDLGLVRKKDNKLRISNPIYESVFDLDWVDQELSRLRPFVHNTIKLFKLDEKASQPDIVLEQVLLWTSGQPFLTQKICQLLSEHEHFVNAGEEVATVKHLVKTRLINNWKTQVAAEHLQAIEHSLIKNQYCDSIWLLRLYQQILQQGKIPVYESPVQTELLNLGLVVQQENQLKVANRIYQSVFNLDWVQKELEQLQPYIQNTIKLFKLDEKACFPETLMQEVVLWTDGQPSLTEYVCQLLYDYENFIAAGEEAAIVEHLVRTRLIDDWENQAAAEHLRTIEDGLIANENCESVLILRLYEYILQNGEALIKDENSAQSELINLGIVRKKENKLKVSNLIYQSVFNLNWVEQQFANLFQTPPSIKPTNTSFIAWTAASILEVKNWIFNPRSIVFRSIFLSLALAGLSVICLSIYKSIEVKILFEQGNDLFHQDEYKKAIAKFDKLLNIDSNYYEAWTNRGYALGRLQEYQKMLESCSSATIIHPEAVYAWNCQGEALHNLKQDYEAISAYDTAITLNSKDHIFWINKTESLLALKQIDTALITIDEAINLLQKTKKADQQENITKELAIAFSHKGKVLWQKQNYREALEAFDQALINDPGYFTALRGRGLALQGLKQYKQAIAQFQHMLNESHLTDTQKAETWYYMGLTYCNLSEFQDGFGALEAALKLKPDYQAAEEAKSQCQLIKRSGNSGPLMEIKNNGDQGSGIGY